MFKKIAYLLQTFFLVSSLLPLLAISTLHTVFEVVRFKFVLGDMYLYYHKKYSICIGFLTTNVSFEIQHVSQGWSLIWNWALYAFFGRFSRTWWWDRRRAAGFRTKYYFIAAPGSTSKLKYFSSLQNEDRSKLRCDSKRKRLHSSPSFRWCLL